MDGPSKVGNVPRILLSIREYFCIFFLGTNKVFLSGALPVYEMYLICPNLLHQRWFCKINEQTNVWKNTNTEKSYRQMFQFSSLYPLEQSKWISFLRSFTVDCFEMWRRKNGGMTFLIATLKFLKLFFH